MNENGTVTLDSVVTEGDDYNDDYVVIDMNDEGILKFSLVDYEISTDANTVTFTVAE
jgi:hypothetical protein